MTSTVKVDLPAEIFDVQTNVPLLHQVVVAQLAAARQGKTFSCYLALVGPILER
jgi:ribosomal protein L4